jgi:hypothetical protein
MGVMTCYFLVTATNTFKMSDSKMGKQIFLKVGLITAIANPQIA